MIFGRKRRVIEDDADVESAGSALDADDAVEDDLVDDLDQDNDGQDGDFEDDEVADDDESDEIDDESDEEDLIDIRDDGPFDIDEVDLDADDVSRIDFGTLIMTPIEGMELQLQVEEKSQAIQSALVVHDGSGIEVALFASPTNGGLAKSVMAELVEVTRDAGGVAEIESGPFGDELYRELKVSGTKNKNASSQRSRIWLVEGPRWMLRAVLMGAAVDDGTTGRDEMEDFFRNLVVSRGTGPLAPGDLIPLRLPESLVQQQEK